MFLAGAYAPLVPEGKILVDGVLASCYADVHQDVAHLTMTPMQKMSAMLGWVFGDEAGFPISVKTTQQVGMLLVPNGNE